MTNQDQCDGHDQVYDVLDNHDKFDYEDLDHHNQDGHSDGGDEQSTWEGPGVKKVLALQIFTFAAASLLGLLQTKKMPSCIFG